MNALFADLIGNPVVERDVKYRGKSKAYHFRELLAGEAEDLFIDVGDDAKAKRGLRSHIIAACVCDANGAAVITSDEAGKLPNSLATALQAVCLEVNGMTDEAQAEAKNG